MRINFDSQLVSIRVFAFITLLAAGPVSTVARAADGGTCISDIREVIARMATPMMMKATLPKDLTAKVDEAAQASFANPSLRGYRRCAHARGHLDCCLWYGRSQGWHANDGRHAHEDRLRHQDIHRHGDHAARRRTVSSRSTIRSRNMSPEFPTATPSRYVSLPT